MVTFTLFDAVTGPEQEGPEIDKINKLWHHYVSLRGAPVLPTCKEIEALLRWIGCDIPDEIIRKAMNQKISEKEFDLHRRGLSLHHCNDEVRRLYQQYVDREMGRVFSEQPESEIIPFQLNSYKAGIEGLLKENIQRLPLSAKQQDKKISQLRKWLGKREIDGKLETTEDLEKTLVLLNRRLGTLLLATVSRDELQSLGDESKQALANYRQNLSDQRLDMIIRSFVLERLRNRYKIRIFALHSILPDT